jgi:hypothetical protein
MPRFLPALCLLYLLSGGPVPANTGAGEGLEAMGYLAQAGAQAEGNAPTSGGAGTPPGRPADTLAAAPPSTQDSLARPKSRADTVLVVRRSFEHREQIITGSVIMSCLALMMVIMNNYNPR